MIAVAKESDRLGDGAGIGGTIENYPQLIAAYKEAHFEKVNFIEGRGSVDTHTLSVAVRDENLAARTLLKESGDVISCALAGVGYSYNLCDVSEDGGSKVAEAQKILLEAALSYDLARHDNDPSHYFIREIRDKLAEYSLDAAYLPIIGPELRAPEDYRGDMECVFRMNASVVALEDPPISRELASLPGPVPIGSAPIPEPVVQAELQEKLVALTKAMGVISERERDIVMLYYGYDGRDTLTLREIGEKYSLTGDRVGAIRDKALRMLARVSVSGEIMEHLAP